MNDRIDTKPSDGKRTLKPCPFCGGSVTLEDNTDYHRSEVYPDWLVGCSSCNVGPGMCIFVSAATTEQAIAAWNNRPLEAELVARMKEFDDFLRKVEEGQTPDWLEGKKDWFPLFGWNDGQLTVGMFRRLRTAISKAVGEQG